MKSRPYSNGSAPPPANTPITSKTELADGIASLHKTGSPIALQELMRRLSVSNPTTWTDAKEPVSV